MSLPECFHCKYGGDGHPCRLSSGTLDFATLGATIVAHGRTFADDFTGDAEATRADLEWAIDCEFEITEDYPHLLLPLTVAAIDACEHQKDLAFVAAGLLENSVVKHGPVLIGKIESVASASAKFRFVLSAIWGERNADPEVWKRVCKAVGHSGLMDTEGRGPSDGQPVSVLSDAEILALIKRESVAEAAASLF